MASVLRRATVFVADLDRAMRFYAGVFGLSVYRQLDVAMERIPHFPVGPGPRGGGGRFVIMLGENPMVGMVGLMQMVDPPLDPPAHDVRRLGYGSVALVLSTADADGAARAVTEFGGQIIMPVATARNIGDEHGAFVPAKVFMAYDPDGTFLEVFEPLA
jgi:predicted enzyme related to lactoylglutathione lyase